MPGIFCLKHVINQIISSNKTFIPGQPERIRDTDLERRKYLEVKGPSETSSDDMCGTMLAQEQLKT